MKNFALIAVTFFALAAGAGTFKDVTMPDTETVAGKKLVLNGMGLREVSRFGIDIPVYVAGLYIEKKTDKGADVLASKLPKRMKMQFLRRVPEGDYRKAWKEVVKNQCDKSCEKFQASIDKFYDILKVAEKGAVVDFTFTAKGLEIDSAGTSWGKIDNAELGQFILTTWFGDKPSDPHLKDGILGSK